MSKHYARGQQQKQAAKALAAFPAFQGTDFESWALRFSNLASQTGTENSLDVGTFKIFCMFAIGTTPSQGEMLFNMFDTDENGSVDAAEFIQAVAIYTEGTLDQKLECAFACYDKNGDGFVDKDELYKAMMTAKGLSCDAYDEGVSKYLSTFLGEMGGSDGRITKKEFMTVLKGDKRLLGALGEWLRVRNGTLAETHIDQITSLFKAVDLNNNGTISKAELRAFSKDCDPDHAKRAVKRAERVMAECDLDKNNKINLEEFTEFLANMYHGKTDNQITESLRQMKASIKRDGK